MKKTKLIKGCILAVILLNATLISSVNSGWTQYGANPGNTSQIDGRAPHIHDEERLVWSYRADSDFSSTPVIIGEILIVGNEDGEVMVLNASAHANDGERVLDVYDMNYSISTSIAYYNGMVFVSNSKELFALKLLEDNTLKMEWYYLSEIGEIRSSPVVYEGKVLITESYFDRDIRRYIGRVLVFDYEYGMIGGEPYWERDLEGNLAYTPSVENDRVYLLEEIYRSDKKIYEGTAICLDIADGREIWSKTLDRVIESSPTIYDDLVFLSNSNSTVIALDKNSGVERWTYKGGGVVAQTFAVYEDRLVYATSDELVSLKYTNSGAELDWIYSDFIDDVVSAPSIMDDTVYIGTRCRILYAFDLYPSEEDRGHKDPVGVSYDLLWKYGDGSDDALYGRITSQVALADGRIYFGAEDKHFYALGNNPPTVFIQVSDPSPKPGENVVFTGVVEDFADIVEYRWYSEELGTLSRDQNFSRSFKEGNCLIMFQAMDEFGEWSNIAHMDIHVEEEEESLPWILVITVIAVSVLAVVLGIYLHRKKKGKVESPKEKTEEFKRWDEN